MNASAFPLVCDSPWFSALAALCGACSVDGTASCSASSPRPQAARERGRKGDHVPESDKIARLPLTAEDLDCPTVDIHDGAAIAARRRPRQRLGSLPVRHRADRARMRSRSATTVQPQGRRFRPPADRPGRLARRLQRAAANHRAQRGRPRSPPIPKTTRSRRTPPAPREAPFHFVSEPIVLPMTRTELADDYSIIVGFDSGKAAERRRPPHKRTVPRRRNDVALTKRPASGFFARSVEDTQRKSPEIRRFPAPKAQPPRKRSGRRTVG